MTDILLRLHQAQDTGRMIWRNLNRNGADKDIGVIDGGLINESSIDITNFR